MSADADASSPKQPTHAGETLSITPAQSRAARALLNISQKTLNALVVPPQPGAQINRSTVAYFESGVRVTRGVSARLRTALEQLGVEFIEGGARLAGARDAGGAGSKAANADTVAGEAYQVIGSLADAAGLSEHPEVQRALDYFSSSEPDGSLLPFIIPRPAP